MQLRNIRADTLLLRHNFEIYFVNQKVLSYVSDERASVGDMLVRAAV